jgi:hypothetical protein
MTLFTSAINNIQYFAVVCFHSSLCSKLLEIYKWGVYEGLGCVAGDCVEGTELAQIGDQWLTQELTGH